VLVVEDDQDIREGLTHILRDEGFDVHVASNGLEALDLIRRRGSPDVIILDLLMPVMSGVELLAILRRTPSLASIPVVVMSAFHHELSTLRERPHQFLSKPIAIPSLMVTIEAFCRPERRAAG
jgi:CheY-like chemotaxis protein